MTQISVLARPKINLCLHILGKRPDGYHTLESLAVFGETGDRITAEPSTMLSLSMEGPFAISLESGGGNIVLQAAVALQDWARDAGFDAPGAALHLDKRLPVASGIGGGSADAAATLNALTALWDLDLPAGTLERIGLGIGADVPVCLESRSRIMAGIGEDLRPAPDLPPMWMVLANPMRQIATASVFATFDLPDRSAALSPPKIDTPQPLVDWLTTETRNDLQNAAIRIVPEIETLLGAFGETGAPFTRMSGSGATCFGLYGDRAAALSAADAMQAEHKDWWVEAAALAR